RLACRIAELLLVGLAVAKRMVGELEVRAGPTIKIKARAEPGAERDHHFHALARDDRQALQIGIVGHPHRLAQGGLERAGEVEAEPRLVAEIGGRPHAAGTYHPRKADRYTLVVAKRRHQARQHLDHLGRRRPDRRGHAYPVGEHLAFLVDDRGFKPGAADVDGERARPRGLRDLFALSLSHDLPFHFGYRTTAIAPSP